MRYPTVRIDLLLVFLSSLFFILPIDNFWFYKLQKTAEIIVKVIFYIFRIDLFYTLNFHNFSKIIKQSFLLFLFFSFSKNPDIKSRFYIPQHSLHFLQNNNLINKLCTACLKS